VWARKEGEPRLPEGKAYMKGASEEAVAGGGEVAGVLRRKEEMRDVALAGPWKKDTGNGLRASFGSN
jgi:hypothetical protein